MRQQADSAHKVQAWSDVLHYNAWEFSSLAYLSIGVYCIGNLLQQVCVRKLGAPVFAVFISMRLLASVIGEGHALCPYASCRLNGCRGQHAQAAECAFAEV